MRGDANLTQQPTPSPNHDSTGIAPERRPSHIVGIGASAGGLEALERFFEKVPAETGVAFVVLQHLSPDFKSLTNELLARRTPVPIHQVQDGMAVERDAVYLLPPRKDMIVTNGRLLLTDKDPSQVLGLPIDYFFRSLAQDAGDRAVGIVLSGTGSDGSRGIRDIHEAGGLIMAQTPDSAKFDGMPKSAIKTGIVDFILPPEGMPQAVLKYARHPLSPDARHQEPMPFSESGMDAVFRLLREGYDIDFANYKPATVARRTERRLMLTGMANLDDYVERLRDDPEELNLLYKDLLIGVTRFFRDKEAYEVLAEAVLPPLLPMGGRDEEFRVWVPACATGEEAYSIAILVSEQMAKLRRPVNVKIFATDVHRHSLDMAGSGAYSEESVSDMRPEWRERYFVRKNDSYLVAPDLRRMVVFAQHNVIKDAPFTKLDLISCRNLLIYFQPLTQKKVLSLFHFGLRTGGVLFLGPSEGPGELEDEFDVINAHWRVYRKRRDVRLPTDVRLASVQLGRGSPSPAVGPVTSTLLDAQLIGAYDALLDTCLPPSLLVNENRQLLQAFAGASRYLQLKDGRFSTDVLDMVSPELRMALTGALPRAFKDMQPMVYRGLHVVLPEGERLVNLTVKPVQNRRANCLNALLCLEEVGVVAPVPASPQELQFDDASRERLVTLETELRYTKENLQATIEELETSNEELQATNEELVASNEELQSTNEELHSVNEELYTVNAEYQKKIAELTELTSDMDNLLTSTEVHTIFLDRRLCIRKFTPMIAETFNLLPQDIDRRIDSFTHTIAYPALLDDVRTVLQTGSRVEKPVEDQRGNWYLMRILPYFTGGTADGVVLTLIDITPLHQAQTRANQRDLQLSSILRNSPNLVCIKDLQGRFSLAADAFGRLLGTDPIGKTVHELFPREIAEALAEQDERVRTEGIVVEREVILPHADGPHTYLSVTFPLRDEAGRISAIGGIQTDVTQLKLAESRAREAAEQRERFLAMLSHELRNPLAAILNSTSVIEHYGGLPAKLEHWFDIIQRRVRHMARLLDDLLDVARITQNRIEIRKQVVDLTRTVAETLEEVQLRFDENRVQLSVEQPNEQLPVVGDPTRLQQIQVNLLLNAAKYTPAGGQVWYVTRREGNQAVIRVRDTGVGMAPDLLDKVFDLFVQADNTLHRSSGGLGVGLTLVRTLVQAHGGRVQAYSDGVGQGSEFVVWLPLARSSGTPVTPPKADASVERDGAALRVLLVEDDADIRSSMKTVLEMDGYHVRTAADGPTALEALRQAPVDVALIDIGLPGMDGYEVVRRLRRQAGTASLHVVALTGYGQASDQQAARDAGFDDHLTKPLKPLELHQMLDAARKRHAAEVALDGD